MSWHARVVTGLESRQKHMKAPKTLFCQRKWRRNYSARLLDIQKGNISGLGFLETFESKLMNEASVCLPACLPFPCCLPAVSLLPARLPACLAC